MTNVYHIIVTKTKFAKIFSLGGRNDRREQSAPPPWGIDGSIPQGVSANNFYLDTVSLTSFLAIKVSANSLSFTDTVTVNTSTIIKRYALKTSLFEKLEKNYQPLDRQTRLTY